jgi:thiol-disulfide isomerase/thioredoxin
MKCVVAAALVFLLVTPRLGAAAEDEGDMPDRTKLGEFVPSSQPFAAPAISLTDSDGHTQELSDLRGKLVIVNLWATWCEPCLREMPSLERLQSRLGERIAVLAVSEDRGGNKTVEPFIAKLGLKSVKIYIDPKSEVGHAFGARGLPTSFLIDREGKVLGRVEGAAEWDSPKILGILEPLLSGDGVVKASSPWGSSR